MTLHGVDNGGWNGVGMVQYQTQRDTMKFLTILDKTSSWSTGGLAEPSRCTQRHGVTLDTDEGRRCRRGVDLRWNCADEEVPERHNFN